MADHPSSSIELVGLRGACLALTLALPVVIVLQVIFVFSLVAVRGQTDLSAVNDTIRVAFDRGVLATNHQAVDPVRRESSHTEADPPSHGVTPEVGLFDPDSIENTDHVADALFQ